MLFGNFLKKLFGSRNQRLVNKLGKTVKIINSYEEKFTGLTDEELKAKTAEFRNKLNDGASLDSILPEAFAAVREAGRRTLNMRHFDVQLIGGMVLHHGKISEMHTGEGKTLVATLPAYLNAIADKSSVHIVTVNDYLAKRDAEWMRPIYEVLGLSVGVVVADMPHDDKVASYNCDIVYGTNNEYGFDYLRDNMAYTLKQRVQKDRTFAIVDEVDSILIDEARTPLIISGPAETSSELYQKLDTIVPFLKKQARPEKIDKGALAMLKEEPQEQEASDDEPGHFVVDEKHKQVSLTELGHEYIEELLVEKGVIESSDSLYNPQNISIMHHLNAALRAHYLFSKDVDYIVQNNEIIIVDEHTGRTMPGRRWSDGLHQAVEAKEKVKIKQENQTLASITFQNYFRLYDKLAGMTGTADTEAFEFQDIYNLEVVVIPTNKDIARIDQADKIFLSAKEKFDAIVDDVVARREKGQPVLLGTASIETSEYLSKLLKKRDVAHQVLNAKFHEKEAEIISEAGRPGVVTIATNMAGRGTDIVLGGNLKSELEQLVESGNGTEQQIDELTQDWKKRHQAVLAAGGLYVLGSERHESRRIDNQLRGRSGRQGDPGETRFFLSMDDNLMRIFASDRMKKMMESLGMEGNAIESNMISRSIRGAQNKVEGLHYEIRKSLLEYDDIANDQRKIIYDQRNYLLTSEDIHDTVTSVITSVLTNTIYRFMPPNSLDEQWDIEALQSELKTGFHIDREAIDVEKLLDSDQSLGPDEIVEQVTEHAIKAYQQKQVNFDKIVTEKIESSILLQVLDNQWREHLVAMDQLRQSVGLRGYAQKDPKQEYKREAFHLFESLLENYQQEVCSVMMHYDLFSDELLEELEQQKREKAEREQAALQMKHSDPKSAFGGEKEPQQSQAQQIPEDAELVMVKPDPIRREHPKIGRNDKCYCGSGTKYKNCHGKIDTTVAN